MSLMAPRAALLALALTLVAAAPAAAQSAPIEAVWSFNGGQVAVERQSDGSFTGTVIRQTQFATCPHLVGEQMWLGVQAQPDGQYFGTHQYLRDADCSAASRGNTAYRVLSKPDGAQFLRVCFSKPDTGAQPTIAADGTESNADDGCHDSDFVSQISKSPPKLADIVTLPKETKGCASRRKFPIRLKEPPGDAIATAKVTLNNKNLPLTRSNGRLTTSVDLRGLPRGRYQVKIVAKTVRGRTIQGSRRYRTCGKKRRIGNVGPI